MQANLPLGYSYQSVELRLVRDIGVDSPPKVKQSADVFGLLRDELGGAAVENFVVICLDSRNNVLAVSPLHKGTITEAMIDVRAVFSTVLLKNAVSVIYAHNHPSGDPSPSAEDKQIFEQLKRAGKLLNIDTLDNIIIAGEKYFSFADQGLT